MGKQKFLKELTSALREELPDREIKVHVEYYKAYIEGQVKEGRKEVEVMAMLGAPRLIAKTLIDADAKGRGEAEEERSEWEEEITESDETGSRELKWTKLKVKVFGILILAAAALLVFGIVFTLARMVVFLLPVIVVGLLLALIIKRKG